MNFIKYVLENDYGSVETNYSFSELTTIRTGGLIKYLYTPNNIESLTRVFKYLNDKNIKYFIIGNGSNVLADDSFFDGVVINIKKMPTYIDIYEDYIDVSASYQTSKLVNYLASKELGDLSFLCGIPGTIGGAVYNNSGAFGDCIGNHILSITYITKSGMIDTIFKEDADFGYRKSIFHFYDCIIISAKIKIKQINTYEKIKSYNEIRLNSQPLNEPNIGSIFMNKSNIKAWEVIDMLGMRGFSINGAKVSEKHTNFIINYNKTSSRDIISLIELIKRRAKLEFGIDLETEITII